MTVITSNSALEGKVHPVA